MRTGPENKPSGAPFAEDLVESDVSEMHIGTGKLKELEHNPRKVVRVETFSNIRERYNDKTEVMELVKVAKELYCELEEEYGIPAPVNFLIGQDEGGSKVVYSVVDKIEGKNLKESETTEELAGLTQNLYASVAKYFLYKFKEDEPYLWDINNPRQYVYGKKDGERGNKIYLVDTDIYIGRGRANMYPDIMWLAKRIVWAEKHFKTKFDEARKYIAEFLAQPLPQEISDSQKEAIENNIEVTQKFLL